MHPLSIMIKPSSSNCNMRCKYCFYFDEANNREVQSYGFISEQTTQNIIKKALSFAVDSCTFMFQGGEPTIVGLPYFENFVELVKKYNEKKLNISYALQTNGFTIDEDFAKFFSKNNFLVGISLDGVKDVNDKNRIDIEGKSTYNRVMTSINYLKKNNAEFNVLSVVTSATSRNIEKIYKFFKKNDLVWQQYIPCLDPLAEQRGYADYSLTPDKYTLFLKKLFDIWYLDIKSGNNVSIRYFDDILSVLVIGTPNTCTMQGRCIFHYVVESNGEVYPCDFYMLDDYKIGNINDVSFKEIDENRDALKFIERSFNVHEDCNKCKWYGLCRGGCMRDRENFTTGEIEKTYYCESFIEFFEYSYTRFVEIANIIKNQRRMF